MFGPILEPEVELMVLLRMRSNKITKTAENGFKMQFAGLISRDCMFFGTRNPNLNSILKREVVVMHCTLVVHGSRSSDIMTS